MSILNVEEVTKYYERREEEFRRKGLSKKDLYEALEGVHHEALAFDILMGWLIHEGIEVEFGIEDFNPLIEDSSGVKCEIDFRLRVEDETLLFGATRFNFNGSSDDTVISFANQRSRLTNGHGSYQNL